MFLQNSLCASKPVGCFFHQSYLQALGKLLPSSTSLAVPFAFFIFYKVEEVEIQKTVAIAYIPITVLLKTFINSIRRSESSLISELSWNYS